MSDAIPISLTYLGAGKFEASSKHWAALADKHYGAGEVCRLVPHEERSINSHNHAFARIEELWSNLPDELLSEYPTPTHLRKKMLIRVGYCTERVVVCSTKADAVRVAAFAAPIDTYSIVIPKDNVVKILTAESMSRRAMGAKRFNESKTAVLQAIEDLLGVEHSVST